MEIAVAPRLVTDAASKITVTMGLLVLVDPPGFPEKIDKCPAEGGRCGKDVNPRLEVDRQSILSLAKLYMSASNVSRHTRTKCTQYCGR